jgi:hypothetical protein
MLIDVPSPSSTRGVVALPIHDALVVPSGTVSIAMKVMLDVFKE